MPLHPKKELLEKIEFEFKLNKRIIMARSTNILVDLNKYAKRYYFILHYKGPENLGVKPKKTLNKEEKNYKSLYLETKREVELLRRIIERSNITI